MARRGGSRQGFGGSGPWVALSAVEQSIRRKVEAAGAPLRDWDVRINYGIKTGCNEAFIIDTARREAILARCRGAAERERTEALIRPILRGRDIRRYGCEWAGLWLIFLPWHFPLQNDGSIKGASLKAENVFREQYPAVYEHMLQFKDALSKRNKAEVGVRYEWYALQRWGAKYLDDFARPKVVWPRLMRISKSEADTFPRFCCASKDTLVADSLCFITGKHLEELCRILNSTYAAYFFLKSVAVLDNGGLQMRQQYVEEIPIPLSLKSSKNIEDSDIYDAFSFTDSERNFIVGYARDNLNEIIKSSCRYV